MANVQVYQHPKQDVTVHKLPTACTHEHSGWTESQWRKHYDTRPEWDLERAIIELSDIGGTVSFSIDQWWGLSCDVHIYGVGSFDDQTYVSFDTCKVYRVAVECDESRIGVIVMFEYILEHYQEWHGRPYDDWRYGDSDDDDT